MAVNKVILVGNVGKDPEVKQIDESTTVANFPLATSKKGYKLKNGTEIPERTDWHNIVVWRGLAKIVEKYVKKGTQVYIEGEIRTRSYEDKDGVKRWVTEIYASDLQMLGNKPSGQSSPQITPSPSAHLPPENGDLPEGDEIDKLPF